MNAATSRTQTLGPERSIAHLELAVCGARKQLPGDTATSLTREDLEDAQGQGVVDLMRWIHRGGRFADAAAAARALNQQTRKNIAAAETRSTHVPGRCDGDDGGKCLWMPAGADPLHTAITRERLRDTLTAIGRLPEPQRNVIVSHMVGETPGDFRGRTGWSAGRYGRAAARGRDALRTAIAAAA